MSDERPPAPQQQSELSLQLQRLERHCAAAADRAAAEQHARAAREPRKALSPGADSSPRQKRPLPAAIRRARQARLQQTRRTDVIGEIIGAPAVPSVRSDIGQQVRSIVLAAADAAQHGAAPGLPAVDGLLPSEILPEQAAAALETLGQRAVGGDAAAAETLQRVQGLVEEHRDRLAEWRLELLEAAAHYAERMEVAVAPPPPAGQRAREAAALPASAMDEL
eukprot:TRINITY_DN47798_c0_g1_i1.p2 TRINITY_DN47798_c0_g1~~TRINITY_DN47798_c0_g1_i1.p2  ORF type:complete len:248 (+),score=105.70 TRINITY_DN47798_c0_g1_i1:80-745(+)